MIPWNLLFVRARVPRPELPACPPQELRLASYLSKLTMVPAGTLHRLLSVALPTASQPELLAVLESVSQKQPDHAAEKDGVGEPADPGWRG